MGERMERLVESVYHVKKGVFTTCEGDPPAWAFHFGSATADLNEFLYGTDASFWVRNIPLIPFVPFFAAAIRRERQTGFLFPKFGESSRLGYYTELPFFWAIDDSQDLLVSPLVYTRVGEGFNLEYRYLLPDTQRGRAGGFFIQESAKHDVSRYVGTTRQDWKLGARTWLKVDATGVSDDRMLADYGDALYQRSSQRVESNAFLTHSWDTWNLVGDLFVYQDLTTKRPVELNRLPDIRLVGTPQPLHDLPGVLWQFEGSAVHFVRVVGSDGDRIDIHPRVSRPIPLDVLTLTPFVGGRLTGYDRTVTGFRTARAVDGLLEVTSDEPRLRRLFEAGADVETKVGRVFNTGGFWNIDAMQHTVEPRLNYTWITGKGQSHLPQWEPALDTIDDTSRIEYSLTNRIYGRTIALANAEPVRWELFRLVLGHAYDLRKHQWADRSRPASAWAPSSRAASGDPVSRPHPPARRAQERADGRRRARARCQPVRARRRGPGAGGGTGAAVRRAARPRRRLGHRRAATGAQRARRRPWRRGAHAGVFLRRLGQHDPDGRRHARLRGRRARDAHDRPGGDGARAHAADEGRDARAPLRPSRGRRPHRGLRAGPGPRRARGQRAGGGRDVGRPGRRRLGRRGLPVVLSDEEPGRLRRRGHGRDHARRRRRARAPPAPSRRHGALPPRGARLLQPSRRGAGRVAAREAATARRVDGAAATHRRALSRRARRPAPAPACRAPRRASRLSPVHGAPSPA